MHFYIFVIFYRCFVQSVASRVVPIVCFMISIFIRVNPDVGVVGRTPRVGCIVSVKTKLVQFVIHSFIFVTTVRIVGGVISVGTTFIVTRCLILLLVFLIICIFGNNLVCLIEQMKFKS